jgi:TrmH family RNA methyltransferase
MSSSCLEGRSSCPGSRVPSSTRPEITSTRNPLVARFRALADRKERETSGRFVVEGVRLLEHALADGITLDAVVYDPRAPADPRLGSVLTRAAAAGARVHTASAHVVAACSQVETPQGVVAIAQRPAASLEDLARSPAALLVVADRIQDPGNLGTIIRIADAAGVAGVIAVAGTVDPFNPKAVRATMGSLFHLPVVSAAAEDVIEALRAHEIRILVADQHGAVDFLDAEYRRPCAIVLGNEGQGVDPRWVEHAAATVRIPMYGRAESLNVAVAAALLLYEARRQANRHDLHNPHDLHNSPNPSR